MRSILTPPVFANEEQTRRAYIVHVFSWSIVFISILFQGIQAFMLQEHAARYYIIMGLIASAYLPVILLNRRGYVRFSAVFIVIALWAIVTGSCLTGDGLRTPAIAVYLLIVLITALLFGGRVGIASVILCSLTELCIAYGQQIGLVSTTAIQRSAASLWIANTFYLALMLVLQYLAVSSIQSAIAKARKELSERSKVQEALYISQERLRLAIEATGMGIWDVDLVNNQILLSPECAVMFGYEFEEKRMAFDSMESLIYEEDRTACINDFKAYYEGRTPIYRTEHRLRTKSGDWKWYLSEGKATQRDEDGRPARIVGIMRDLSNRKIMEEKLRTSQKELKRLLDNYMAVADSTEDLIWSVDMNFGLVLFNKALINNFKTGVGLDIKKGMTPYDMLPDDYAKIWVDFYSKAIQNMGYRTDYISLANSRMLELTINPIFKDGEIIELSVFGKDVTERRKAEAELRNMTVQLEQRVQQRTAQLEAANSDLKAFSYSISHDLQAPVRRIASFLDMLIDESGECLTEQSLHYTRRIIDATNEMNQMIDSMLSLSQVTRDELNLCQTDLSALARNIARVLQEQDPSRQATITIADDLVVYADPRWMNVALENLMGNAWKFTSKCKYTNIEVGFMLDSNNVPIYFVRDNGAGFDMEYASSMFVPFKRLHKNTDYPGTGVGLSTVQRVIRRHGGSIWAEGTVGQGATIYFTLPGVLN
ncbi:MAG: PAS domain S-box protein [Acidobacteriota bacterium]